MQKRVFENLRTEKARSACAFAQSDQGLPCPLIESLDTIQQRTEYYFTLVQDDLNLRVLCMFEGTFSLDTAHIFLNEIKVIILTIY